MRSGRLLLQVGLSCLLFSGLAAAQAPFQLTLTRQDNTIVIANGTTLTFSDPVGQSEKVRVTATYQGQGTISIPQLPQVFGSTVFTATLSARPPLTLSNGDTFYFEIQFQPTSSAGTNAQLTLPYVETFPGNPTPVNVNGAISIGLVGTAPSFVFSYILQTDQNVVIIDPGGSIPFPPTRVNTTVQATFNITNRGSGNGQINAILLTGSAFKLVGKPLLPATLAAGQSLQIILQYTPVAASSDSGELQITIDPNTVTTIGLQGSGVSTNTAFAYQVIDGATTTPVNPNGTITLPDTNVGENSSVVVEVKNTGNAPGTISSTSLSGAGFQLSDGPVLPQTLAPNSTAAFTVSFSPTKPGSLTGRLAIGGDSFSLTGRGLGSSLSFAYLSGGVKTPLVNNSIVFSPVTVTASAQLDLVVTNTGTLPARIANIGINEANSPFSVSEAPTLPVVINPNSEIRFKVGFTPVITGFVSGTLRLDTTVVTLIGSGTAPPLISGYTITGPVGNVDPRSQPTVRLSLSSPYPAAVAGTLVMSVTGDLPVDPAVQFATGGRTVSFVIPANTTDAIFDGQGNQIRFQTGTVASAIVLTPSFATQAGGLNITPGSVKVLQLNVAAAVPTVIVSRLTSSTGSSLLLTVTGFTTTRSLTALDVKFNPTTGFNLPQTQFTIDLRQASTLWFQNGNSQAFGGQFTLTVPFTLQGTVPAGKTVQDSFASLSVTVSNERGASTSILTTP